MHDLDITHSDIKLENIVLSELKKDRLGAKNKLKLTEDGKAPSFGQIDQYTANSLNSGLTANSNTDYFFAKVVDFGFSRAKASRSRTSICGTPNYMSPELLLKKKHYGKPADVWALGVLLYYMMTNKFPYYARSEEELIMKV